MDTLRSSGFSDALFEIRKRHKAIGSTTRRFDASATPDVQWITVKGTHIPLDENGTALADTSKNLHEVTTDEAGKAISDHVRQSIKDGWMREADSGYKPKLIQSILSSEESRNAALNIMYENFKYYNPEAKTSFEEFLDTPVTMYRGGHGQKHTKDDIFSAYSFDRKVAEKFAGEGGNIYTAKIRPIDIYGSLSTNGESEIFVPTCIAPNGNKDSVD